ncbi:hypothetical protein E0H53_21555, partial [Rhizobium leguminosarum bv. viciae]
PPHPSTSRQRRILRPQTNRNAGPMPLLPLQVKVFYYFILVSMLAGIAHRNKRNSRMVRSSMVG